MKSTIKESKRSEEVREGLREHGFRIYWTVQEDLTRVSYWTNGCGKAVLLLEHAHDLKWESWDLYRPLTDSNKIADTYDALEDYAKQEGGGLGPHLKYKQRASGGRGK